MVTPRLSKIELDRIASAETPEHWRPLVTSGSYLCFSGRVQLFHAGHADAYRALHNEATAYYAQLERAKRPVVVPDIGPEIEFMAEATA